MSAGDNLFRIAAAKERAERTLAHAFGQGALDEDALDERMEALAHAEDLAAVERLTLDLDPAPPEATDLALSDAPSRTLVPIEEVQEQREIVTIFGEHQQRGPWVPARRNRVMTILGSGEFDLREAQLAAGVTEIEIRAALAEVTLIVPPELRIDVQCNAILSSIEHDESFGERSTQGPSIRVTGWALLSSIEIKERARGEGFWQARKRRKRERKRLRKRREQRALPRGRRERRDT